ncbi:MAG: chemotaxis response regulator protein-glutamate methylesterase [Desulfovibrionales bacterium]|nr:chemotaxis response regulator protein-glutamate methylesterase [Desulfovibrionales bacterium]
MIRVVVVDDSAFMRKAIGTMLENDPEITVVGTAKNGQEGLELVRQLDPDVVTLDIEMPVMDGLTTLRHIMMEMPRPVLMISSLTVEGAEATLKALDAGAVDFIPKKLSRVSLEIINIEKDLQAKVKAVAKRPRTARALRPRSAPPVVAPSWSTAARSSLRTVVAVGVSTGGPPAVQSILSQLPADFPATILIAQHMPQAFTGAFAKRLNSLSPLDITEAQDGDPMAPGKVYVAPGGSHLRVRRDGMRYVVEVSAEPAESLYKPSANELIASVAEHLGPRAVGLMLTGMGSDGLEGSKKLKSAGGRILAQSDATCVVYGMPKAVVDAGLADQVVDLADIPSALMAALAR